jgi:2-succinyl-6-hydroxy-2,4-cyclohexadiene-1-carboxylate synthase
LLKNVNGIQYHFEIHGDGEPLLLLHGFTGSIENWRPLVPHLAKKFSVITVDLPGHGKTDSPTDFFRYDMSFVAADLVQLMHSLGHAYFHLVGYSMGGRLALYLTIHYPSLVNKLVLESASPGLKNLAEQEARRTFDNQLADRIEQDGIKKFVDFWESISLWESQKQLSPPLKLALRQIRLNNNPAGLANSLRGMGTGQQPSLWSKLKQIESATLLITGQLDHKFCGIAAEMLPTLPNSQHDTVQQAGHTVQLEQPVIWLQLTSDFLIKL